METANKSQSERIKSAFNEINHNISIEDKSACMQHFGLAKSSLWRIMNEEIKDTDKAIDVLLFFKQRISKREKALQKAVA